jgi:hypothetical protein
MTNTYYVFHMNNGSRSRTLTMPAEVANYVYDAVSNAATRGGLALRLWEKANPALHTSDFDRASLREVIRLATGRNEYHKVLHHWHESRNIADVNAIADFAISIKKAMDNHAFRVVIK